MLKTVRKVRNALARLAQKPSLQNTCWILLLLLSAAFIVYGCAEPFQREEWQLVLNKAVAVCFQCIGLG